jgi:ATP-dependent Clp protease ATP-binding subunit ClpC
VVFEQFDDPARMAIDLAQQEARGFGHKWVGTEHMLLGVLRSREGAATQVLERLGVTHERARNHILRIEGVAEGDPPPAGEIPLTPRVSEALEQALREAFELRSDQVGTEHIVLGLLDERTGLAVRVMADGGLTPEQVRAELLRSLPAADGPPASRLREPADAAPIPNLVLEPGIGPLPYTPQARHVIELAHQEAVQRGDQALGPEHLLIALGRGTDPIASSILRGYRLDAERLRGEVARWRRGG